MEEKEPLCARCARLGKTCCQTSEVYVTPGDVARIEAFTGRTDFYEFRSPVNPEYQQQDDDPLWAACVFRPDGTRRILRRKPEGDCVFLGAKGCILPLEVRPLLCRLYPFRYTARGLEPDLAQGCPVHLLPPGVGLLEALRMTREQGEAWHRQLYAEIRSEPHARLSPGDQAVELTAPGNPAAQRVDTPHGPPGQGQISTCGEAQRVYPVPGGKPAGSVPSVTL